MCFNSKLKYLSKTATEPQVTENFLACQDWNPGSGERLPAVSGSALDHSSCRTSPKSLHLKWPPRAELKAEYAVPRPSLLNCVSLTWIWP